VSERVSARLKNKTWRLANPKVFEYRMHGQTNTETFEWIVKVLKEESRHLHLKGRHVDTEAFENSGKYIDYAALMQANQLKDNRWYQKLCMYFS
jgi:hypothetical protein